MGASENKFDIIIIGSGIGGLACASVLAQKYHKKVLVLERHFKIGGFTHIFKRKGKYEWDVGLHYIGRMQKGKLNRAVFDYITRGKLDWFKMPDPYDVFVYPDFTFKARDGEERLKQDFIDRFPEEKAAIEKYFADVKKASKWYGRYNIAKTLPPNLKAVSSVMTGFGSKLALMTTGEYLDKHFRDPRLKAALISQWGDYGLPPSMSAFFIQAIITGHYFEGGFYPVGGSKRIADGIIPVVEEAGGKLLVNHFVDEVILDKGKAVGVKVREKVGTEFVNREYFADTVISNAGAYITYQQLMPKDFPLPFKEEIENFPRGTGHVTLHLGLKEDPRRIGFMGENYWIYASYDHDQNYAQRNELMNGKVSGAYVSFPSMKNPEAQGHTVEVIAFIDAEPFRKWADQPWKNRDAEYEKLKEKISNALLDFVEARFPGFRDLIDYQELSTPLSTEFFTGHRAGNIYGLPAIPRRYKLKWLGYYTPVRNLFLTGSDTAGHGIVGAMMAGVVTAGIVSGSPNNVKEIFNEAKEFSASLG